MHDHSPDVFTIVCCNESFQLALDHSTIKTLLQACRRARPLLSSRVARFLTWCHNAGLFYPDGSLLISLTPSDKIALSLRCDDECPVDRSWLAALAEQGNAAASYFLARIFQIALSFQQSVDEDAVKERIFDLLKDAADAGHPMAQFHVANRFYDGYGVERDQAKAAEIYRDLADRGMVQAQVALGRCYESSEGVDQSYDTAVEWYSKAADQGNDDGRLRILFLRGWFAFIGHGVEQSDADALSQWLEVSTNSTDPVIKPIATHMVGWMFYLGRGTLRDKQKGVEFIRKGQSPMFPLGESECLAGEWLGPSRSPAALKFFKLCQLGSEHEWLCKHLMALCLTRGFGTKRRAEQAAAIFEELANEGRIESQCWIGECYCYGWGVDESQPMTLEWYRKAADQGDSYGQYWVGACYRWGNGVTKDHTQAVEWLRKSAAQGNRFGQNRLGDCFRSGEGVDRDMDVAISWWRKAADQGYKKAMNSLVIHCQQPDPEDASES
ncbi:uncharacterized protein BJ171DRAFT_487201 [Polychytrium aggregatum]|uniref:uncharacterized protein n=1 Tax=Polychytrium aggregatum TaxID=110093 RepID=UPI0022FE683C|nr:uncharacterized protein BJ171DRAFT_487201 [Polychytrium aggregatum]KAI9209507.1 hypothetical protein BJ171DRAFT_487201 [Polychytrium aggregatum]